MAASLHVVCPHCDSANRLPEERLTDAPRCGRCHEPLFTGVPTTLSTERFRRHLAASVLAGEYGIRSIPTLAVFRDGREVARRSGALAAAEIVRWVRAQAV